MARSVNCLGRKNTVQVHLIGAKPIVQVKRWNERKDHSSGSLYESNQTAKQPRGAARHGNQEPPGQAPRCTGQREKQPQQTRDFTNKSWYALTY